MDQNRGVPDGTDREETQPLASSTTSQSDPVLQNWKPNETFFTELTSMGFTAVAARKALYYTDNASTEVACDWIFRNEDDLDTPIEVEIKRTIDNDRAKPGTSAQALAEESKDDLYKMVFVVNSELSMGVGKIAAQVAHAALGLHRMLMHFEAKYGEALLTWLEYGETKIVLRGDTTSHLIDLENKALQLKLPCYLVHDAGKTQVKSGSTTVLAIFGSNRLVDQVTGHLKLY